MPCSCCTARTAVSRAASTWHRHGDTAAPPRERDGSAGEGLVHLGTYFGAAEEARYLSGIAAGKASPSGKIGYVAAFPIPEVIRGINAFTLGAQSVNPDATVQVTWTKTWFDPTLEKEAAEALLDAGVDVLAQHQDTTA
ncbi:MAG: BMP family ABC transporter substrate-binding protein, partial [Actinobacteria bacterium]|nr:BMP family ABC transporter substrate-binding protein [Actinomycetota bacterium]